jgi:hypothetical protein
MEEQSQGFMACLSQKAMVEKTCSLVEDYMGEKEGVERHGSLITYKTRVPTERRKQPTNHSEFSMYEEDRKGSMMVKTYPVDKYIGVDVVQKGV